MPDDTPFISGRTAKVLETLSVTHSFLIAVFVGGICIGLGINFGSTLLALLAPVLVMCVYIYLVGWTIRTDISRSDIGDSCYFLGFTLTLVSLAAALISLAGEIEIETVVRSFGVALATTIVGLTARLFFTTLSSGYQSSRERLEKELEDSTRKFIFNLDTVTSDVNLALTSIGITIKDANEEISKSYKNQMEENIELISTAVTSFAGRLDEVEVSQDLVVQPINEALVKLIATINDHNTNIRTVNEGIIGGNRELSLQINQANDLVNQYIEKFTEEFETISTSQIATFKTTIDDISGSILQSLGDIKDVKVEVSEGMEEELKGLAIQITLLESLIASNKTNIEAIKTQRQATSAITDDINLPEFLEKLNEIVKPVADSAAQVVDLKEPLESMQKVLANTTTSLQTLLDSANNASSSVNATTDAIDSSSLQLSKDISEVYSNLSKQLRTIRNE